MFKLIVSIVPHDSGEFITNAAKQAGAGGGTIIMGRGTAQNGLIQLLGLGDTSKDIVYILVDAAKSAEVVKSIQEACSSKKAHFGVLFTVAVNDFIISGTADIRSFSTKQQSADTTSTLSARGSRNLPKVVTRLFFRAI